jgi:type IV secretion system protein VirD4
MRPGSPRHPAGGPPGEGAVFGAVLVLAAGAGWFWLASELSVWLVTRRWPGYPASAVPDALARVPYHLADPTRSWPASGRSPAGPPGVGIGFYVVAAALAIGAAGVVFSALRIARRYRRLGSGRRSSGTRWAHGPDLRSLRVRYRRAGRAGRVVIGRSGAGRRLLATETRHSLLVIGPTQSGKTTGLAVPALLEWSGPIVATSVKDDLVATTAVWRSGIGPCWLFDPTVSAAPSGGDGTPTAGGATRARWSPISACGSWSAAQKMATWLVESTPGRTGLADAAFWYTTAGKQLAPLLLAARCGGMTMGDVVRWTDSEEFDEPTQLLRISGEDDAAQALQACAERDDRIRSSVTTTLETVLSPFEDPLVAVSTSGNDIDLPALLSRSGTLFLCGPSHEQARVQGLFAALVSSVVAAAVAQTSATGRPLDPPLLVVLDEAANIAPIRDLDTLASTAAGLGIQLVTICQDLAQLAARYGPDRARTIANNHRAKLLLSGVGDLQTLDLISGLAGEQAVREESVTHDRSGGCSRSVSTAIRRLAPTDQLRRVAPGEGVLVYGHLPPARIRLRPWYAERQLRQRVSGY